MQGLRHTSGGLSFLGVEGMKERHFCSFRYLNRSCLEVKDHVCHALTTGTNMRKCVRNMRLCGGSCRETKIAGFMVILKDLKP